MSTNIQYINPEELPKNPAFSQAVITQGKGKTIYIGGQDAVNAVRITQTFQAPIERVWEVWTNPEHIIHWWGPNGFTNTIDTMDVKEGGEWKFTMHGPDGTNFPNRSVYKEIIPLKKSYSNTSILISLRLFFLKHKARKQQWIGACYSIQQRCGIP